MNRRAFTTIELIIALVVGGIIAGAVMSVLRRQQRFYTNAAQLVEQRVSLRDATGMLPAELRALSPAGGDVLAVSDSALEIDATIGTAVACDTVAGGQAIDLVPVQSAATAPLSAYTAFPQPGDIALVYDARSPDLASDDAWVAFDIADVASVTSACAGSPLVDAADATSARFQLRFTPTARLSSSVRPGAFVRILRRVRYRFYRAGTGEWYLGYSEWDGTAYGVVQPVSGPFAKYSDRSGSGLRLRYFDSAGAELPAGSDASRLARAEVLARGASRDGLSGGASYVDSQVVTVRLRNP